jgi:hypothetical protein
MTSHALAEQQEGRSMHEQKHTHSEVILTHLSGLLPDWAAFSTDLARKPAHAPVGGRLSVCVDASCDDVNLNHAAANVHVSAEGSRP